MSNPTPTNDPSPPAISAAELRRRLLSSTPPPIAASATEEPPAADDAAGAWNSGTADLLSRLRMPGNSGSVPIPTVPQTAPLPPVLDPLPGRAAINRRTPSPSVGPGLGTGDRAYGDSSSAIAGALSQLAQLTLGGGGDPSLGEIQRLRSENHELRTLLEEMKHLLQEASESEQQLVAKDKEFQAALAEKDTHIDELTSHLSDFEDKIAKGELAPPPPTPKTRTELEEWGDELEKESARLTQEKKKLEDDRRQLHEDEEALEQQMRSMEVSMARERAILARQETELKRLSAEIQHELDILQRGDAGLREQMAKFQRRAAEVMTKPAPNGRR